MQSALSRIWICVAVSVSYDDNHYTTGTSLYVCVCVYNLLNNGLNIIVYKPSLSEWINICLAYFIKNE